MVKTSENLNNMTLMENVESGESYILQSVQTRVKSLQLN